MRGSDVPPPPASATVVPSPSPDAQTRMGATASPGGPTDDRRVVIVTGASSGIGRATALRLAAQGMTVVLAARRAGELESLSAEIEHSGGRALAVETDVTRMDHIRRLMEKAMSLSGRIDGLVNVAGVGHSHSIMSDDAGVEHMLAVNLLAPIRLMRAVVPIMMTQRSGAIVNIGSIAGEIGISGTYSATKFGLRGITDSVRRELAGSGIGVTLIEPGYIDTPLTVGRPGRMPGPDVVARAVEGALRRPRRRVIVPGRYRVAVFLSAAFPGIVDRRFAGKAAKRTVPAEAQSAPRQVPGDPSNPHTSGYRLPPGGRQWKNRLGLAASSC
jgi:NAD(P)-dependent dehydrogenase (short-subunit alcohol dehydrogenase family)